jgi:long-chain acyl-CoA synthetase
MNLVNSFDRSVELDPDKVAVFWGESEITYGELSEASCRVAGHLTNDVGIEPGDRVGIWMKNRPEFIPALVGIMRAGGVAVPINNFLKSEEVAFIAENAGLKAMVSEEGMASSFETVAGEGGDLRFINAEEIHGFDLPEAQRFAGLNREESDLAVIIYTSGTTGKPKGAMLSHGNLLHNLASCKTVLDAVGGDRFVLLLPMFHSFMLCVCILLPLSVGGSIILIKSLHPPKNILQEIIARQGSILPAIPQLFRALASSPPGMKLPLRLAVSGAAPLPAEILNEFSEKLHLPLIEGYGLSEASPVVSMNPIKGLWKPGSIGVAIPGVEVRFRSDDGKELGANETGELCVRGGNVMQGYWDNPEATASTIRDGWLLTGDIGHMDEDGYIYITDRKKDMLLVNGINVYPREIEEILYQFEGVKEAAVVGKKDARKGEMPVAFVVMNEGVEAEEKAIVTFLRGKLADYKTPRKVVFMETLPKNATGKVLKTSLREHRAIVG